MGSVPDWAPEAELKLACEAAVVTVDLAKLEPARRYPALFCQSIESSATLTDKTADPDSAENT